MPATEIAFSYLRFSSTSQAEGDSVRRQSALRDDWLKRHPVVKLDTSLTLVDSGVSGFRGKHRSDKRNALAQFLDLVRRGRVPAGSWLIVESVDRLSREHPDDAIPFLYDIIRAGIRIVTLSPSEVVYEQGMELGRTLFMLLEAFRGHGESARKSDLCGQAWSDIKHRARVNKEPLGKNLHPAWVKIENGKHVLIPEAVDAVRKIYELAANGWSTPKITRYLNDNEVPAIGRRGVWVRSYVQKIIMDRSVLGEYQPTKGRHRKEIDGEPICDYWPRVISDALFDRVRAGRIERSTHKDGRGRRASCIVHPFSGVLTGALDVCPMYTIKHKGRYYIVSKKGFEEPEGDTHRRTFPLGVLTGSLLRRMRELASADLFTDPSASSLATATAKLGAIERKLAVAVAQFEADPENETWANKVNQYDRERRAAVKELADVRAATANPLPARWEEAVELMSAEEPERLRQLLVGLIEDVRVLIVKRVQTRLAAVQVFFAGGSERSYLVRWTRCVSLPKCRKPESVIVYSFARRPTLSPSFDKPELTVLTPAIDLRDREQVNRVERALMKLDLTQPLNQFANDAETATDVHIWLSCLEWSPN